MSFKYLIPTIGVMATLMSSCNLFTPYDPGASPPPPPTRNPDGSEMVDSTEQERIRLAREEAARNADPGNEDPGPSDPPINNGGNENSGGSDYRRAILIPGKEGFVFNPFTNNPVDVRGIPSGTLVRDPQDPNTEHKFRVP